MASADPDSLSSLLAYRSGSGARATLASCRTLIGHRGWKLLIRMMPSSVN